MAMDSRELARRMEDSFEWWTRHRDLPSDVDKKIDVQNRAINDCYALFSHFLEAFAALEDRMPGSSLWRVSGLSARGDMTRLG